MAKNQDITIKVEVAIPSLHNATDSFTFEIDRAQWGTMTDKQRDAKVLEEILGIEAFSFSYEEKPLRREVN